MVRVRVGLRLGLGKSLFPVCRPEIKGRISAHNGIRDHWSSTSTKRIRQKGGQGTLMAEGMYVTT